MIVESSFSSPQLLRRVRVQRYLPMQERLDAGSDAEHARSRQAGETAAGVPGSAEAMMDLFGAAVEEQPGKSEFRFNSELDALAE